MTHSQQYICHIWKLCLCGIFDVENNTRYSMTDKQIEFGDICQPIKMMLMWIWHFNHSIISCVVYISTKFGVRATDIVREPCWWTLPVVYVYVYSLINIYFGRCFWFDIQSIHSINIHTTQTHTNSHTYPHIVECSDSNRIIGQQLGLAAIQTVTSHWI